MRAAGAPALPLLAARDLAAPLAWCAGCAVSAGQFVAEALALAERLPATGRPINLCQDRYRFALGLAAALLRGQTSLLPPNALPETLRQVPAAGAAPYLLVDDAAPAPAGDALPRLTVARPQGVAPVLDARALPCIAADLEAACLLTSGSTGAPQPHAKRWGALVANIGAEAERLAESLGRPAGAGLAGLTLVATVPAQHSYGLESSVLLALLGGAAFDAGRPYYPADIVQALARVPEPRALVTTPFHLKTLLGAGLALPATALLLSATAPLSPQLAAQAEAASGGVLIEIYGCTEAGQVASRRTTAGEDWTTLGALRLAQQPGAERGHCSVAGGHVLQPTPLADVLELQDARRFRLLGRANDLIHVAGKRSSLAHLNYHLNRIEGVQDGAFWLPDESPGEVVRPVAFVVASAPASAPTPGMSPEMSPEVSPGSTPALTPAAVIQALRRQLEPAFVPRRVLMVPALPREATGKLTAAALREFALATLAAPAAPVEREFVIAADHPAFAGHFPGRPLLPGALLLALVMQALQAAPALRARLGAAPGIASAKFLGPVGPGARLHIALSPKGSGLAFEVRAEGRPVARGLLGAGAE
ncbi:MAG: acyl-CoA synthetase [Burkholderiales bacterium]|nr:acyl-CoA synthetase [Burkholderiales bacterium]